MTLKAGDTAPDFTLPATGVEMSLAGHKGRKVELYFYPKDDTPCATPSTPPARRWSASRRTP